MDRFYNLYKNLCRRGHDHICNQCPSQLMLWVRISIRARCTTLC